MQVPLGSEDDSFPLGLVGVKIGEGGYNKVFLMSSPAHPNHSSIIKPFVLRLQKEDNLPPYQVVNEVTCISMISSNHPDIPVPKVYAFAADTRNPFIDQEYIDGETLSSSWSHYTENEKQQVAHRIADIIVDMGEVRFDAIGGFTGDADSLLGPTVEGSKLFKNKFHSKECYNIGPFNNTEEY